ncbi:MAG: PilZ domain-containing protein [Planctomycetes bacterium]|nr:PilZ domain-containing protein [Planctomycetota bacterium]
MIQERRHEERIRHPHISAACMPIASSLLGDDDNIAHRLVDVSTSGTRLVVTQPLEPGDGVVVRLDHTISGKSVQMDAEVRWCLPLSNGNSRPPGYVTGLRFNRARGVLHLLLNSYPAKSAR